MGEVVEGAFGLQNIEKNPDATTKRNYICYYCLEEIEFIDDRDLWIHVTSGEISCETIATPSNLEVD